MTTSSYSENEDTYNQIVNLFDSIRHDLFIMEARQNDKTDDIIKFYEIHDLLVNTTLNNLEISYFCVGENGYVDYDPVKININEDIVLVQIFF